jgi:hypothetical protein
MRAATLRSSGYEEEAEEEKSMMGRMRVVIEKRVYDDEESTSTGEMRVVMDERAGEDFEDLCVNVDGEDEDDVIVDWDEEEEDVDVVVRAAENEHDRQLEVCASFCVYPHLFWYS